MSSDTGGAAAAPTRRSSPLTSVSYLPGLDGLRALAVTAVVLYHADVPWMQGGFLGVDVFFVISGYLITLLLLAEYERKREIDLKSFWIRRARRLLPALFALLIVVSVWCALFLREEVSKLKGQILAASTYITNWYLVATNQSYFDQLGRPPLLRHLWSLAVEEQFYLLWPLMLVVIIFLTRRRIGLMALAITTMILASTAWMAYLYVPGADPSRVYYGTDTRAAGLLVGSLLALFWRPSALSRGRVRHHAVRLDVLGAVALLVLAVACFVVTETGSFLYRGGFLFVACTSALLVASVSHPGSRLGKVLGFGPLRWLGTRSYGIYLWQWPVLMLTRPGLDTDLSGPQLWILRIGLILGLTEISYRIIEAPIRAGGLSKWVKSLRGPATAKRDGRRRLTFALSAAALSILIPVFAVIYTSNDVDPIAASLLAGQQALAGEPTTAAATTAAARDSAVPGATTAAAATSATTAAAPTTAGAPTSIGELAGTLPVPTTAPPTTVPATTPAPAPTPAPGAVFAIGDSVMLGAAPALLPALPPGSRIDAVVGRQFKTAVDILAGMKANGQLGQRVVVHLGNNGSVDSATFDQMMAVLKDVPEVLFLTVKVPRGWQDEVNNILYTKVPTYPNAKLLDWKGLSEPKPEIFYSDGIHLRPPGAQFYAELVKENL